jgi:CubicO group peptidase (beta-lactamase class C family)
MLLAGYIVERVSGVSYYDYVRDHIFKPAGMTASASYWKTEKVDNLATGYTKEEGGKEWKSNYDTLPMRGTSAGGGFTTVQELVKFANALMAYKLLDRQNTELLATTKWKLRGNNGYAYGFMDREIDGLRVIGHGGGAPGMNGDLLIFPQTGYVVAVLANMDPPAAGRLADTIAKRLPAR